MNSREKKLVRYIQKHLKNGISQEKIKKVLLGAGWEEGEVDIAIGFINSKPKNIFGRVFGKKEVIDKPPEEIKEEEPPEEIKEEIEKKPRSLTEKIDDLNEKIEMLTTVKGKKKRDKHFDLPFWQRGQLKSLAKKSKLLVIYPTINRGIKTLITEVKDEWCVIDGKPRKVNLDHVFLWQGKFPTIILPEWDLQPFGTKDYYDAEAQGRRSSPASTIIRMIANKEQFNKMGFSGKTIIFIVIGAVILAAVLFGNFGG